MTAAGTRSPRDTSSVDTPGRGPVAWLLAPAPAERLAVLRVLVGCYATAWATVRLPAHLDHVDQSPERWQPVGVLAPFGSPLPEIAIVLAAIAAPVLGLLFVAGRGYPVVGPLCAATMLVVATLDSSWGQVFHTENLMVLHLVILALAPGAADALVVGCGGARRADTAGAHDLTPHSAGSPRPGTDTGQRPEPERTGAPEPAARYGWPVRLAAVVVTLTYLVTGIAKLRLGGTGWLDGETLRHLVAYDNVRKAVLGDAYSPLGTALVEHAWVFAPLAVATLAVELGAVVALLGGRWRTAWVAAAWTFHLGVLALMAIVFAYPLSGVAFAPFFRLERLADRVRRRRRGPSGSRGHPPGGGSGDR